MTESHDHHEPHDHHDHHHHHAHDHDHEHPEPERRSAHDPLVHINTDHGDDLLAIARAFGGCPDATAAQAEQVDETGVTLVAERPGGPTTVHVGFTRPVGSSGPRRAFLDLSGQARAALDPHPGTDPE